MRDDAGMRTTLDLDADVLMAIKEIAEMRGSTAGKVLSELVRVALAPKQAGVVRNGVPVLPRSPAGTPLITTARVNELRDDPIAEFGDLALPS
jgi:hypothetical protein